MIGCLVSDAAEKFQNKTAIYCADSNATLSFTQFKKRVELTAKALPEPKSNMSLAFIECNQRFQEIVFIFALIARGYICVPISFRFSDSHLIDLVNHYKPALIFSSDRSQLPFEVLAIEGYADEKNLSSDFNLPIHYPPMQPVTGVFTSGSTGMPKLAIHAYSNHMNSANGCNQLMPLKPGNRNLVSLPIFHIGGLAILFRNLMAGSTMLLGGKADDADFVLNQQISHISLVETQLQRLISTNKKFDVPYALVGGGPVAQHLVEQSAKLGIRCWKTYGMTEAASQIVTCELKEDGNSHCRLVPNMRMQIDSLNNQIRIRGPNLFLGYLKDKSIDNSFMNDGWFNTGDIGIWENDAFQILGRTDNMFVRGGENIQPEEIETHLLKHEGIESAIVLPMPDPEYGKQPLALLKTSVSLNEEELISWLKNKVPNFKIPTLWYHMPDLANVKGAGFKINRSLLRQRIERQLFGEEIEEHVDLEEII